MRPQVPIVAAILALATIACSNSSSPATPTSTRIALPTLTLSPVPTASRTPTPGPYIVKAGDTLSTIAASQGVATQALIDANPGINPDTILIGQQLIVPRGPTGPALSATATRTAPAPSATTAAPNATASATAPTTSPTSTPTQPQTTPTASP